ncbi:MAG: aminotransferase class V-fold PLP-dependent enzyme, partial [Thermoplasmata archaeon]
VVTQEEKRGANAVFIPPEEEISDDRDYARVYMSPEDYEEHIDQDTKMVLLTGACFRNGIRQNKIKEIGKIAHENGAYLYVDDTQNCGVYKRDVEENIDFLTVTNGKYLCGGSGNAFLYVDEDVRDELNPWDVGWFGEDEPFDLDPFNVRRAKTARGFEGGSPRVSCDYITSASLRLINEIGIENIHSHVRELVNYLMEGIHERGFDTITPSEPARRSFGTITVDNPEHIERILLDDYNISVAPREIAIRIAPHFYNNKKDIDEVLNALEEIL